MTAPPPLGWPQPPYTMWVGTIPDCLERDGYAVVPNPHPSRSIQRLLVGELVQLQAERALVMRPVTMADGSDGLLVVDRAVWACPREQAA